MFEGFDGWLRVKDDNSTEEKPYQVSELIQRCNFALERELGETLVEGEVASFKVNQGKWVFFDLKEGESSVSCFMPLSQLTVALSDGMQVRVRATPKLTRWGKFSLTIRRIIPVGEGSIKKSFELLKKKLTTEGLFDPARKRPLPVDPTKIGVISSTAAAGYIDFLKILENRWGGLEIKTINTQVQGIAAAEQIIRALQHFNERGGVEIIAILRGGGSADDLAVFNDEQLVRAIAASKIPVITGIGHEVDESLADLAADIRASTPSNAAERLTRDRNAIKYQLQRMLSEAQRHLSNSISDQDRRLYDDMQSAYQELLRQVQQKYQDIIEAKKRLAIMDPEATLRRGYAILSNSDQEYQIGNIVKITTFKQQLTAEIKDAQKR